ncbi:hypothetical protein FQN57_005351 [Myotisia sp. PD_48]|nr:hypothetical protein FQN57_005351 [Myotisia sp. PD_48]
MAICITFGTHEFSSQLQGYENVTAQCHNCGNWSARCVTRWPWFTVCFVALKNRPDVESQHGAGPQPVHGGPPPPAQYGPIPPKAHGYS